MKASRNAFTEKVTTWSRIHYLHLPVWGTILVSVFVLTCCIALADDTASSTAEESSSLLFQAIQSADVKKLASLLEQGADINAVDQDGKTPLLSACGSGVQSVISYLLDHGANQEAADPTGATALHICAMLGHADAVKLLIKHGADPLRSTHQKQTALHLAGNEQVVAALLPNKELLNSLNSFGYTPLHSARHSNIARKLLDFEADLRIRTPSGRTAMELASVESLEKTAGLSIHSYMLGRLRGLLSQMPVSLTNISISNISNVRVTADSPSCSIKVTPASVPMLRPTERVDLVMTLTKDKDLPEGDYPLFLKFFLNDHYAGSIDLRVDTRSFETPEDLGMIRLAKGNLRPAGSRLRYIAYLGAPLLILFAILVVRGRRTKST